MMVSPSIYNACQEASVPTVQTLHNYRLLCPSATFFRNNRVCEDCRSHGLWRGIWHGCYRSSRAQTSAVALMLAIHRWRRTWASAVDRFVALSRFSRQKFVEAGMPAAKISVKPNFLFTDPGCRAGRGEYALFVGRLSPEKGVLTLLEAWRRLRVDIPFQIAGDGPELELLQTKLMEMRLPHVRFLGQLPHEEVIAALKGARWLIVTSQLYENFPMTIVEAFACGVPVIASQLGAMLEIIEDGRDSISSLAMPATLLRKSNGLGLTPRRWPRWAAQPEPSTRLSTPPSGTTRC